MKILTGAQMKEADAATIQNEPIESADLMERASEVMAQWIGNNIEIDTPLLFIVGRGNNSGDGLAMARMLSGGGFACGVYPLFAEEDMSAECALNFGRLPSGVMIMDGLETVPENAVIIDAILGTGAMGDAAGRVLDAIFAINDLPNRVISIDLPSGMSTEFGNDPSKIVHAETTLAVELPKLAMLLPEAGQCCGRIEIMAVDLDGEYIAAAPSRYEYLTQESVEPLFMSRNKFAHKYTYGHALLVCGSEGMAGAAVLSACGALRSGCGLVTVHLPREERHAVQANCPSALVISDEGTCFSTVPADIMKYASIGIGCGLGQDGVTVRAFGELLTGYSRPMVIDADALNIISSHPELRVLIPTGSILTPHPGELERLVGRWTGEEDKINKVVAFAQQLHSTVIVKGAHTMICLPDGRILFNSTGNSGMAKGGSGDVLTGLLTGLLARGYEPMRAAMIGVYLHGLAGDKAAEYYGAESMNASDLPDFLAEAFNDFK